MKSKKKILVIGGGIAGLAAADFLALEADVTLFEARPRLGGRIWTDHSWPERLDLGAQVVHGFRGNPVGDLARELRLETRPSDYASFHLFDAKGREVPERQTHAALKSFKKAVGNMAEIAGGFEQDLS